MSTSVTPSGVRPENLKRERGGHCYLYKFLGRPGEVDGSVSISIDFREAVSSRVLIEQERICPKASFCTWICLFMNTLMMDLWQK